MTPSVKSLFGFILFVVFLLVALPGCAQTPSGEKEDPYMPWKDPQYTRAALQEVNLADYGNIMPHPLSVDKSSEEIRRVLGEI